MPHRLIKAPQARYIGMWEVQNWGWKCPNTKQVVDLGISTSTAAMTDQSLIIRVRCPCCGEQHGAPLSELGVLVPERSSAIGDVEGA